MDKLLRTQKEVSLLLEAFEKRTGIFDLTVQGVAPWQLLRSSVSFRLQNLPLEKKLIPRGSLYKAYLSFFRPLKLLGFFHTRYVILTYYSGTRLETSGKFKDIWFDDILLGIPGGKKLIKINAPGFEYQVKNALRQPQLDVSILTVLASLLGKLFPVSDPDRVFEKVAGLMNELPENSSTPLHVKKVFSQFLWLSWIYKVLLRFISPKACLVQNPGELSLLHAAQALGIQFIELQHGILNRYHPYIFPESLLTFKNSLLLPDHIAVYGDYWRDELKTSVAGRLGIVKTAGNPVLESYRETKKLLSPRENIIVFTTQGIDHDGINRFLTEFLRKTQHQFRLILKLHPSYDSNPSVYQQLLSDPRVTIQRGNEGLNSLELIVRSKLHLSIASACHYDALAMGIPTVIVKLKGSELMDPLIEAGKALVATSPDDLIKIVEENLSTPRDFAIENSFCAEGFLKKVEEMMFSNKKAPM